MKYGIILYWSGDGPAMAEMLCNVELTTQEWIETAQELNRPVPEPKGRLKYA